MRFHTKRYDITRLDPEEFSTALYEISLTDGYVFEADGTGQNYAEDYEDLQYLISNIITKEEYIELYGRKVLNC